MLRPPPPPPDTGDEVDDTGGGGSDPDVDDDRDGYTERAGDCDDGSARSYPGAREVCGNGRDEDCDGSDLACGPTAAGYHVADATVCDLGTWGQGHFGMEALTDDGYSACVVLGEWYEDGGGPGRSCPDCVWTFNLNVRDSVAVGPYCDDIGWFDGMFDGYEYGWGMSPYYLYGGYLPVENLLWKFDGREWGPFAGSIALAYYDGYDLSSAVVGNEYYFVMNWPTMNDGYYYYP